MVKCGFVYPYSENGGDFCRKKQGHKGSHTFLVYWNEEQEDLEEVSKSIPKLKYSCDVYGDGTVSNFKEIKE